MLLNVKPFEVLPQNNGYGYLSESFALNWQSFTHLAYKKN